MNPKLSLVIGIICIAFSAIFVKLAGVAPVTAAFYRIAIAWALLLPWCLIKRKTIIARTDMWIALLAGVVFASDVAVWNMSILKISATVSTLLANLAPVWVGLISFIFLRKRSGLPFWAGTAVAILGMLILVGYQDLVGLQFNIGIPLAIAASILYAIYILLTKNVLQRTDTLTFMFYNMLGAAVFLLLVNLIQGAPLTNFPAATWGYFIGMGLICQLAGWITINYAISLLPATKTSVALLGQTVVTALIAAIMLHEKLQVKEIVGCMVVLAGIAITFIKKADGVTTG
ncbi:DMT family transporter [Mucilaginibacter mali]|uniref:DMT family transporter n=1 Tax=Mucilaginibacter mali TaxID=2740462 RepID=A0A7D4QW58_9SPHI|nr:DMT family transporter [Mucilaginibacter mali]QKJ32149.1 DMT family transporter [Mucilaginibacter mali]